MLQEILWSKDIFIFVALFVAKEEQTLIILGSIITTAVSLGASFLQNTAKTKKSYKQIALIMCITSVLVSKIGFSNLVNILYLIFGYLGIIQIIILITHTKKKNRIM